MDNILAVDPQVVVTDDPGYHARIEAGIRARKRDVPVKHTIKVLDEAYGG